MGTGEQNGATSLLEKLGGVGVPEGKQGSPGELLPYKGCPRG